MTSALGEHKKVAAQLVIDRHLKTDAGGRCVKCQQPEPCPSRVAAHRTFEMFGGLPRRHPGAAQPWFDR